MVLIKDSRKDQIIAAATELFKAKGFSGTSMRDLAAEVGMVVGSLYSFLNSKDEILQTICFDMAGKFLHHIDDALAIENCSHEDRLYHAIQGHVRIMTDDINATSVFWHEWKYMQEPWLSDFSRMQMEYETKFKTILDSGVAGGEFSITDTTFTTMAMLSSLNGLQKWRTYSQSPDELGRSFAELFVNGIKH